MPTRSRLGFFLVSITAMVFSAKVKASTRIQPMPSQAKVTLLDPDQYGQRHPVETEELIEMKLEEMEEILMLVPDTKKQSLLKAEKLCPELLTKEFKLRFLRCDVFNADRAAERYVAYWQKRHEVFGEKAFQPLTLASMNKEQDRVARKMCVFNAFETSDRIVAFELFRNYSLEGTTRESLMKVFWYLAETALEHTETQKRGIVVLSCAEGVNLYKQKDVRMAHMIAGLKGSLPLRLSAYHIVQPPGWSWAFIPLLKVLMGERLRKRILFQTGTREDVLNRLARFGLSKRDLPEEIGGDRIVDMEAFYEERQKAGL